MIAIHQNSEECPNLPENFYLTWSLEAKVGPVLKVTDYK